MQRLATQNMNQNLPDLKKLEKESIIPDVIPADFKGQPTVSINISYRCGNEVLCGNTLEVNVTASIPRIIKFSVPPPEHKEYVLLMTDPDAPSRSSPYMKEWAHWVLASIKTDTLNHGTSSGTNTLLAYNGPSPPKNSGPHRYVFLLFLAPEGASSKIKNLPSTGDSREPQKRGKWNGIGTAWNLANTYNFQFVGINWFYCENKS